MTKTGESRWIHARSKVVERDERGDAVRIIGNHEDITERKRAEEESQRLLREVQEEKEKLSALINSITDEVWFADTQGRFALANPSALREFQLDLADGIDVEALVRSLEVLRPDGSPRPVREAPPLRALAGEVVTNQEELVRTPATGELRYRQVSASPVRDTSGDVIGIVSVVRDITESKRAEETLQEYASMLENLLQRAADGICVCHNISDYPYVKFTHWNPRMTEITGYTLV
jgi:PAS domain-containing protein